MLKINSEGNMMGKRNASVNENIPTEFQDPEESGRQTPRGTEDVIEIQSAASSEELEMPGFMQDTITSFTCRAIAQRALRKRKF